MDLIKGDKMNWVSVKDRLPINKNTVDVHEMLEVLVVRDGYITFEIFQSGYYPIPWSYFNDDSGEITHWMSLPELPKDNK